MEAIKLKVTDTQKHFEQPPVVSSNYSDEQKFKIAKTAKDFESLLTSMMLKSMNQTTNGIFGEDSYGGDFFNTIFENEIGSHISNQKSLGVAQMLYKKITGEEMKQFPPTIKMDSIEKKPKLELKVDNPVEHTIKPSNQSLKRLEKFDAIIEDAANKYGLDKNLIKSVVLTESAGNERAISTAKAKGLMQLMDGTASDMGVKNVWDPRENINGGTKYLSQMLRQYNGDLNLALASYNAGPGNVNKYNGVPPFEETRNYIQRVLGYYNHLNQM
jgi:Rod binding domain-containing protein